MLQIEAEMDEPAEVSTKAEDRDEGGEFVVNDNEALLFNQKLIYYGNVAHISTSPVVSLSGSIPRITEKLLGAQLTVNGRRSHL